MREQKWRWRASSGKDKVARTICSLLRCNLAGGPEAAEHEPYHVPQWYGSLSYFCCSSVYLCRLQRTYAWPATLRVACNACLQRCGTLDSAISQPCHPPCATATAPRAPTSPNCVTTKNVTSYSCSTMSACGRAPNTNSLFSSGGARNYVGPISCAMALKPLAYVFTLP